MGSMPPGRYLLMAGVDGNNNRRLDFREALDSLTLQLDSSVTRTFWAFKRDTLGPGLSRVAIGDSVTLRLELTQVLPSEPPPPGSVTVLALPDSTPVAIAAVWSAVQYDSVAAAERTRRGAERDTAAADTAAAARDTVARPVAPAGPPTPEAAAGQRPDTTAARRAAADTSRAARLLRQRPRLSNTLVLRLEQPLAPGSRYLVMTEVPGMLGIRGAGRQVVAVPAKAP
jgi:hypothetical protein